MYNRIELYKTLNQLPKEQLIRLWYFITVYYIITALISGVILDYTVDFWLVYFGKETVFPFLVAFLLCLIPNVGKISITVGIVTFVLSYFL